MREEPAAAWAMCVFDCICNAFPTLVLCACKIGAVSASDYVTREPAVEETCFPDLLRTVRLHSKHLNSVTPCQERNGSTYSLKTAHSPQSSASSRERLRASAVSASISSSSPCCCAPLLMGALAAAPVGAAPAAGAELALCWLRARCSIICCAMAAICSCDSAGCAPA